MSRASWTYLQNSESYYYFSSCPQLPPYSKHLSSPTWSPKWPLYCPSYHLTADASQQPKWSCAEELRLCHMPLLQWPPIMNNYTKIQAHCLGVQWPRSRGPHLLPPCSLGSRHASLLFIPRCIPTLPRAFTSPSQNFTWLSSHSLKITLLSSSETAFVWPPFQKETPSSYALVENDCSFHSPYHTLQLPCLCISFMHLSGPRPPPPM